MRPSSTTTATDELDVAVANYLDSTPEWEAAQPQFELRVPEDYVGQPSHLFRNEGGRKFRDVTREAGLAMDPRGDEDPRPSPCSTTTATGGRISSSSTTARAIGSSTTAAAGRFEETTAETGAGVLGEQPRAGMGVAVGDPFGTGCRASS